MKKYHLRVLFLAPTIIQRNNKNYNDERQYYDETVVASTLTVIDGLYIFKDANAELIASYPTHCTIIEQVDKI